jgi:hypothetical protein
MAYGTNAIYVINPKFWQLWHISYLALDIAISYNMTTPLLAYVTHITHAMRYAALHCTAIQLRARSPAMAPGPGPEQLAPWCCCAAVVWRLDPFSCLRELSGCHWQRASSGSCTTAVQTPSSSPLCGLSVCAPAPAPAPASMVRCCLGISSPQTTMDNGV